MERELFLTAANEKIVEKGAREIAAAFALDVDEARRRIRENISPYPPRAQCKEAIEKVRAECMTALSSGKAEDSSGQDA